MKNLIKVIAVVFGLTAVFFFFLTAKAVAQDPAHKISLESKSVKDTVIKGVSHKLYIGSKGGRYIIMTSKKTGKQYKRYFAKK